MNEELGAVLSIVLACSLLSGAEAPPPPEGAPAPPPVAETQEEPPAKGEAPVTQETPGTEEVPVTQEVPKKLPEDPAILEREPEFEVRGDGTVTVTWTTVTPTAPGTVHYGVYMPDQKLHVPQWCGSAREEAAGQHLRRLHTTRFSATPVATLAKWHTGKENGTGRLAVRIAIGMANGRVSMCERTVGVRWFEGRYRRVAALIEGPFVCCPTESSVCLAFGTDMPTRGFVTVEAAKGPARMRVLEQERRRHEITVTELTADTSYRYQITLIPADDPALAIQCPPAQFRTVPARGLGRPVTFAHFGNTGAAPGGGATAIEGVNADGVRALVHQAYQQGSEFIICAGDLVTGATSNPARFRRELRSWKRAVGSIAPFVPFMVAGGDRDVLLDRWTGGLVRDREDLSTERVRAEEFVQFDNGPEAAAGMPPYKELVYSFSYGASHFACVYTNYRITNRPEDGPGNPPGVLDTRQLQWLREDLSDARARGAEHLFVIGHAPGFPCGGTLDGGMYRNGSNDDVSAMRDTFWKILGEAQVAAYLCADERNYSRLRVTKDMVPGLERPVWQIVSGAVGAPFDAPDPAVPWAAKVAHISCQQSICVFTVGGSRVALTVLTAAGDTIEEVLLAGAE